MPANFAPRKGGGFFFLLAVVFFQMFFGPSLPYNLIFDRSFVFTFSIYHRFTINGKIRTTEQKVNWYVHVEFKNIFY